MWVIFMVSTFIWFVVFLAVVTLFVLAIPWLVNKIRIAIKTDDLEFEKDKDDAMKREGD